ncbi:cysteine hydrolase family protein [Oleidesulfovibrio sp.]|uniref:cysteine hydrolase family protein n=1 Tax=Oleidesulfovibrio sp. TaxID=2909707 RepID=UPI003A837A9E
MKTALLVVDVQRAFFDGKTPPADGAEVAAQMNVLIKGARAADVPVIFVQHEKARSEVEHGSEGWQVSTLLDARAEDNRIYKKTPDSFYGTELGELLDRLDISRLVICGYATEYCVDTTVRRAATLGYAVQVAADAHTTDDKAHLSGAQIRAHHNATWHAVSSFPAPLDVVSAADVVFSRLE